MAVALSRYGGLQRDLAPHTAELLALGVQDMRPQLMPERFEQALTAAADTSSGAAPAADRETLDRLADGRPTVARWCARLSERPPAAGIDHNDLHAGNVLVDGADPDRIRFYDWGDAVLAHPFASALVALRTVRAPATGARTDDPRVRRLRDAYLDAFRDVGPHGELVETLELACRVAMIARTLVWARAIGTEDVADDAARAPFAQLAELLDASYLGGR